jgi:hypothetical protein
MEKIKINISNITTRIPIRSKENENKFIKVSVSLDWDIRFFKIEKRLKKFLREEKIKTLDEFIQCYDQLYKNCPWKALIQLETFKNSIHNILTGPPYTKETMQFIKKNIIGPRKRPTIIQKAFLNALYFFESIFNKSKEFKTFVNKKAQDLHINWVPIYRFI